MTPRLGGSIIFVTPTTAKHLQFINFLLLFTRPSKRRKYKNAPLCNHKTITAFHLLRYGKNMKLIMSASRHHCVPPLSRCDIYSLSEKKPRKCQASNPIVLSANTARMQHGTIIIAHILHPHSLNPLSVISSFPSYLQGVFFCYHNCLKRIVITSSINKLIIEQSPQQS